MPIPRIYVDSCAFIDLAKHKAQLSLDQARCNQVWTLAKLLEAARNKEVEVFASSICVAECIQVMVGESQPPAEIQEFYKQLLTSGKSGVTLVQTTQTINELARDLRWSGAVKLKTMDSIHLATAVFKKCGEFITTDGGIAKMSNLPFLASKNLKVILSTDTDSLPSKYREIELGMPEKEI